MAVDYSRQQDGDDKNGKAVKETQDDESNTKIVSSISSVSVTVERKPFMRSDDDDELTDYGVPRANIAATRSKPHGTTEDDWAARHQHQTVLQQHIEFFDRDRDSIIWPHDTYIGFHRLGYNLFLCILSTFIIHANFSYPTLSSWMPDPLFRIHVARIHKDKHGSDSGTYDTEGRFVPQKFEDMFAKYADGGDTIDLWQVGKLLSGQRLVADPIGWGGAFFEWMATYILLWPEDGRMRKEDIRGVYDGSIFYTIAARREKRTDKAS